jgi:hypothetical protein
MAAVPLIAPVANADSRRHGPRGARSCLMPRIGPISRQDHTLSSPDVVSQDIEASYRDMAADQAREQEALEWSEVAFADSSLTESHAPR